MGKGIKKNSPVAVEHGRLSQLMPSDAFSVKIMHDRSMLLAAVEKDDHSIQDAMTSYIRFVIGQSEWYGIPYKDVLDVKPAENITKVPMSPSFVIGISYWHGKLIPIIDVGKYFNIDTSSARYGKKIIAAISNEKFIIGLAFDDVAGVDSYLAETLDHNISINQQIKDQYIYGIHAGKTTIFNVKNLLVDISSELMSKKGSSHV